MDIYTKRWQALGFLVAGAFLSPLDYFIVNMALPAIQNAFGASDQQLQLVVAIYGLTYAALIVCGGRLGDIYGRKRIFIWGLYLFLFSSLACAFSPNITILIVSRFKNLLEEELPCLSLFWRCSTIFLAKGTASSSSDREDLSGDNSSIIALANANL